MKQFFSLTICLLFISISLQAQKVKRGDLNFLKNEKELNIVFDWSKVIIDNKYENDFVELKAIRGGEEWKNKWHTSIKKGFQTQFIVAFNEILMGKLDLRGGEYPNANYKVIVNIQRIDSDGETYAEVLFCKMDSDVALIKGKINGDGGRWGSVENLFGNGFKLAGYSLGKIVLKSLK